MPDLRILVHISLDSAADDLWFKYGASFYTRFFPQIGLTTANYLPQAAIAFIFDLAGSGGGDHINQTTLTAAGLACVALHLAGAGSWKWGRHR